MAMAFYKKSFQEKIILKIIDQRPTHLNQKALLNKGSTDMIS